MISQQETRPRRAIRRRSKYRWRHLLGSGVLFLLMLWFLLLTLFFFLTSIFTCRCRSTVYWDHHWVRGI